MQKYDVILADPPWSHSEKPPELWGEELLKQNPQARCPARHYPVMSIDAIIDLPISVFATSNCALFMWGCWPLLFEMPAVAEAWGFSYRTIAWVWVKANSTGFGHFMGLGNYTRANTEPCLLFVKGKMPVATKDVLALIYSPRREHSRKPDEQYGKIERLYPNMRYLELFARKKREGWDSWGNEVESDIEIGVK
jgi:N6-adenosine-specific RNA methylase IME4